MAQIEKLAIQGIRSYGPYDREVITFFHPLTLILGSNGTGKTTIIECLKYITTGEMPSGAKINAAFINDPKLSNLPEVKAQVSLQFKDIEGNFCVSKRSLCAIQKKNKIEMKTLEGMINKKINDEKISVSSKCANMDREMINMLGVSKAILDNVIFCHQEDSNWPLSEGKVLKQKFDDIFSSTRYVKAMESIRKTRMEKKNEIINCKGELKYLMQNKERAEKITEKLNELEEREKVTSNSLEKINDELNPFSIKLAAIEEKEEDLRNFTNSLAKLDGEKKEICRSIEETKKNIKNIYKGTREDLIKEIKGFEDQTRQREQEVDQKKDEQNEKENELEKKNKEKNNLEKRIIIFNQEFQRIQQLVTKRNNNLTTVAKRLNIELEENEIINDQISNIESFYEDLQANHLLLNDEYLKEKERINEEMDRMRDEKMKIETERKMRQDQLKEKNKELKEIIDFLGTISSSSSRLNILRQDIENAEEEIKNLEEKNDVEEMRGKLARMQKNKNQIYNQVKLIDREMAELNQNTTIRTQIEFFIKDKTSKQDNIKRLMSKNQDSLKQLFGEIPHYSFKEQLEKYIREQSKVVKVTEEKVKKIRNELTKVETTMQIECDSLLNKQNHLTSLETKVNSVTNGEDYELGLTNINNKLQNSQDKRGHLLAMEYMFQKYLEKLEREDPDCPLCHRSFEGESEVKELITEVKEKLNLVPQKLEGLKETIEELNVNQEQWIQIKPLTVDINSCKKEEIPKLEANIKNMRQQFSSLSSKLTQNEETLESFKKKEMSAKGLTSDSSILEKLHFEVRDLEEKIFKQKSLISSDLSTRSLEEVQKEKDEKIEESDKLTIELERLHREIERMTTEILKRQQDLHQLKEEKLIIEKNMQEKIKYETNKSEIIEKNKILTIEIEKAEKDLSPILAKIENLSISKTEKNQLYEKQKMKREKEIDSIKEELKDLKDFQFEIDKYKNENREDKLNIYKKELKEITDYIDKETSSKQLLGKELEQLRELLSQQKERERDLHDNLIILNKKQEVVAIETKVNKEKSKLGIINIDEILNEKNNLKNNIIRLSRQKDALSCRKALLEGEINSLKSEIKSEPLINAYIDHRKKYIELKTLEVVTEDIDKYYKALDRSIMAYHSSKMNELNKIIQQLWISTYRGTDIEKIEIRSDEDEGSGANKQRRNYHYRVVMVRSGVELDMRGRCSAGQKVLASLIIRLSLAETFCLNSGILALDEPTTNLDRENIDSLALALLDILKSRSLQKNFQLIIITHDENFVEKLGKNDYVDYFYRVKKDEKSGSSKVEKTEISLLQS